MINGVKAIRSVIMYLKVSPQLTLFAEEDEFHDVLCSYDEANVQIFS